MFLRRFLYMILIVSSLPAAAESRLSRSVGTWEAIEGIPESVVSPGPWTIHREGAAFLKPRFENLELAPGRALRVLDGNGREVERIDGARGRALWGLAVPGDRMTLEFVGPGAGSFVLVGMMVGDREALEAFLPGAGKSICAPAEFTDAVCHQGDAGRWSNVLATVGVLEVSGDEIFFCTGISVSPRNLVLTTETCLSGVSACENTEFVFGFYRESCGSGDMVDGWTSYRCAETVASSPFESCEPTASRLDFSLHRVEGEPAGTWGYADPDPTPLTSGEGLYIVQHADGRPLELSEGSGGDVVVDGSTLRYFGSLDTESSSVGAPVFRDGDDRLVALHHCGGCASPGVGNRGVMMRDIEPSIAEHLCADDLLLESATPAELKSLEGNGDGVLDPGETWSFVPRIRNVSCALGATAVTATFSAAASSVDLVFLETDSTFGDLGPGEVKGGTPVRFRVVEGQACAGSAVIDLVSIDDASRADVSSAGASSSPKKAGATAYLAVEIGEVPRTLLSATDFAGGFPAGWTVDHQGTGEGEGSTWTTEDPGGRALFATPFAIVDSEFLGPGFTMDERLSSPAVDTTGFTGLLLRFRHEFRKLVGEMDEKADVEVRSGAGAWTRVLRFQETDAFGEVEVDLSAFGAADFQVRFRYFDAEWEKWWALDDIELLGDNGRVCYTGIFGDGFESGDTSKWSAVVGGNDD